MYVYIYINVRLFVQRHACSYVYMIIRIYVHTQTHTHTHTNTHTNTHETQPLTKTYYTL